MRHIYLPLLAKAQPTSSVGIGTSTPDASALVKLRSSITGVGVRTDGGLNLGRNHNANVLLGYQA